MSLKQMNDLSPEDLKSIPKEMLEKLPEQKPRMEWVQKLRDETQPIPNAIGKIADASMATIRQKAIDKAPPLPEITPQTDISKIPLRSFYKFTAAQTQSLSSSQLESLDKVQLAILTETFANDCKMTPQEAVDWFQKIAGKNVILNDATKLFIFNSCSTDADKKTTLKFLFSLDSFKKCTKDFNKPDVENLRHNCGEQMEPFLLLVENSTTAAEVSACTWRWGVMGNTQIISDLLQHTYDSTNLSGPALRAADAIAEATKLKEQEGAHPLTAEGYVKHKFLFWKSEILGKGTDVRTIRMNYANLDAQDKKHESSYDFTINLVEAKRLGLSDKQFIELFSAHIQIAPEKHSTYPFKGTEKEIPEYVRNAIANNADENAPKILSVAQYNIVLKKLIDLTSDMAQKHQTAVQDIAEN